MAAVLRVLGYDVRCTFDGTEGWRIARHFRPDVCILDVGVPGMDGYDLAIALRQFLGKDVLLVALTGDGEYSDRMDEADFDWMFRKPVAPTALQEVIAAGRSVVTT